MDLDGLIGINGQRDVESDMKSRTSGTSSATKTRSIQLGQGPTEQPWLGFGKQQVEINQYTIRQN